MATALLSRRARALRLCAQLGSLARARGCVLIAGAAYQRRPTRRPQLCARTLLRAPCRFAVWGCAGAAGRRAIALRGRPAGRPLSCGTFRREPATRQFDWSFAATPRSRHRIARQNGSGPPPAFPRASPCPGVVHCLSGRMCAARWPSLRRGADSLRTCTPWSVFQDGAHKWAPRWFHAFAAPAGCSSPSPRGTCALSVLRRI